MAKTSHGPSAHYHHSKLLGTSGALYSYEALLEGRVWSLKSYGLDAIKTGYFSRPQPPGCQFSQDPSNEP